MGMFSGQIPDCPVLFAFVDGLPNDISARLTRDPFFGGRFAAWLPMVFDYDEAYETACALVHAAGLANGGESDLESCRSGLREYLALCFLVLALLEDHDDMRVEGLRRVVARGASDIDAGARPFDSEIRACELEDAEEGSELETALDAFMRSSGPEGRREAVRVVAQIIEGLAAEITA